VAQIHAIRVATLSQEFLRCRVQKLRDIGVLVDGFHFLNQARVDLFPKQHLELWHMATARVLADLRRRLEPLSLSKSRLNVMPPRKTRVGSPLVRSRVHWVEPKLVAEITYLTWTAYNLLRHTVYVGLREDKPADQVRREAGKVR
jgi:ATP dependent DNA ligase C terminal region